ncbi:hypothetical protein GS597_12685 [Synechococcales cyanobacterium C]|uniref:Insertion element IS150 protein InsJ-like helix-turn-helix domain-containing protein n=1 Tax=Petrachloros mirabilis ULC683 TaxID=2781853 RepID=A0A8K2A0A1_9CYAN|nr:helix-turn-helix domain-containing protein [Petrachloros mirabilis]NCJ07348.1 hypothetical protein [Petrachloros mirabilis ULC683]
MRNFLLEHQQKVDKISVLTEFIQGNPDSRELKRAIAVKMALEDKPYFNITQLLGMRKSCITKWKNKFEAQGIDGIKLGYQGRKSYLSPQERIDVISWLKTKSYWDIVELM